MEYKTGTLVEFRSRPWVVQQSSDKDILPKIRKQSQWQSQLQ